MIVDNEHVDHRCMKNMMGNIFMQHIKNMKQHISIQHSEKYGNIVKNMDNLSVDSGMLHTFLSMHISS